MFNESTWTCDRCGKKYDGLLYAGKLQHYDRSHRLSHENWGSPQEDLDFCPECYPQVYKDLSELLKINRKLKIKKGIW